MDQFKETFRVEAFELLEGLEHDLMALESDSGNKTLVDSIFRAMHTIKGSSSMFGMQSVSRFAHELEMALDALREARFEVGKGFINVLLSCRDHIHSIITDDVDSSEEADAVSDELTRLLRDEAGLSAADRQASPANNVKSNRNRSKTTYQINFTPSEEVFLQGSRPLLLIRELSDMGEMTVVAQSTPEMERFADMNPEHCHTSWVFFLTTEASVNDIRDVFIFVENDSTLDIKVLDAEEPDEESQMPIGEILVRQGVVSADEVQEGLHEQKALGSILVEKQSATERDIETAVNAQNHLKQLKASRAATSQTSNIRVDARRLDDLVTLVGELVTVQARLSQIAVDASDEGVLDVSEELERLVIDIRENAMSIRMLPIGTTFSRYKRLIRDLSTELNKDVTLLTIGGETEIDKTVIDKLSDPMVHLIRNALDHGIEDPEVRRSKGKPIQGTITLTAEHVGASVHVIIEDDGGGLNKDAIREKAVARGLISESAVLSDEEIYQLIMHPGFSTATTVTSVSGRGVGMDVVQKQITDLGGTVHIESEPDLYTRIVLELPLTLAIIEGMLVEAGEEKFILPLSTVESCVEFTHEDRERKTNGRVIRYRESLLPYVRIRDTYDIPGDLPEIEQIVVLNIKNQQFGITVDTVVGSHQTVIKNLGQIYNQAQGVTGATILGDGSIALILDPMKLIQQSGQDDGSYL